MGISIHAPLAGSDRVKVIFPFVKRHFNPRSPRGERLLFPSGYSPPGHFNPRSPRGERPERRRAQVTEKQKFQSTLPSRGATHLHEDDDLAVQHFNPRSPRGERHQMHTYKDGHINFNPRSPRGERRQSRPDILVRRIDFNPRSPRGERRSLLANTPLILNFNPRSPRGERHL